MTEWEKTGAREKKIPENPGPNDPICPETKVSLSFHSTWDI